MTLLYLSEALEKIKDIIKQVPGSQWTQAGIDEVIEELGIHTGEEIRTINEDQYYDIELYNKLMKDYENVDGSDLEDKLNTLVDERDKYMNDSDYTSQALGIHGDDNDTVEELVDKANTLIHDLEFKLEKAKVFLTDAELAKVEG